jgi:radical SAM superfamily enzyme with C-terminal helix-hairpin-helix motif
VAELETYTGCVRYVNGGCRFCMEPREGKPLFREEDDIAAEVRLLHDEGVRNFRLGGQTCFYSYKTTALGDGDRPRPNPEAIQRLLAGIREAAPRLRVLHIDNANPAVLASNPDEARAITRLLVRYTTPGNVAAFGLESVDPAVARRNNLNASPEEVTAAVRILNEEGGARGANGMPHVLPGLNFIGGLAGESATTHDQDLAFLHTLVDEGLQLRRINLRQLLPMTGGLKGLDAKGHKRFMQFKRRVREEIDNPLLRRMLPVGTRLGHVWLEAHDGDITFGRQIGSYPLLAGIPYRLPLEAFTDVVVTEYGQRSVTGFHAPFPLNSADARMFQALPGVGRKRAAEAVAGGPFADADAFFSHLGLAGPEAELLRPHVWAD